MGVVEQRNEDGRRLDRKKRGQREGVLPVVGNARKRASKRKRTRLTHKPCIPKRKPTT